MKVESFEMRANSHNANAARRSETGIGWAVAALIIVGELAGAGLVALPTALVRSGFYTGIGSVLLLTLMFGYTSHVLGKSWIILHRFWPHYREIHCRKPYPEIGRRAFGKRMGHFVSICIDIAQFGTCVVYLILSARNIHDNLSEFFHLNISFCILIVVVALVLLPLTFLKSPEDFWQTIVAAMVTEMLAVALIVVGAISDYSTCSQHRKIPPFRFSNYFLALGTMVFAWGGHAVFPTVQHDMKKPQQFTRSTILSFSIVVSMYMTVCILGYLTYGDSLRDSVINSLQSNWIQQSVNILITVHCMLAITIMFNPIMQEAEEIFNVPHHFCPKRVIVRSGMMLAAVFVAESIPTFGPLVDLIGGSSMTFTSLIFPCLFFLYLRAGELKAEEFERQKESKFPGLKIVTKDAKNEETISLHDVFKHVDKPTIACCFIIIGFGVIGGCATTFSAIKAISYTHFTPPCYLSTLLSSATAAEQSSGSSAHAHNGHVNCCGPFQNITTAVDRNISEFCSAPNFEFYL